ncbi:hypothetical protein ACT3CD_03565 [Geofilum sp. OHC36d9]
MIDRQSVNTIARKAGTDRYCKPLKTQKHLILICFLH